ncbi:uncharacterized protein ACBT44_022847 isoform 1-T1 [Syngnathus typhle]
MSCYHPPKLSLPSMSTQKKDQNRLLFSLNGERVEGREKSEAVDCRSSSSSSSSCSMAVLPLRVRMFRVVWRLKSVLIVAFGPLLLLPLALSTKEAACAYVILLMALFWCTEVLPLAVTALLPTILFPLLGIMQSKDVCMQYLRDSNMLFVGGLMVAVAVEHWNLHKRIALKVLLLVGIRPARLMLGFMSVTAFLSMWISNTATAAMMVPIVHAVLDQLHGHDDAEEGRAKTSEDAASRKQSAFVIQMPEADASERTGEGTEEAAVETASHEDVTMSSLKVPPQDKPPSAPKGQGALSAPLSTSELEEVDEVDEERKRLSKGLLLSVCYAASIGGIATLTGTGPNLVLLGQMSQLFPQSGGVINSASWFVFAFPTMMMMLAMAWILLQQVFIGRRAEGEGEGASGARCHRRRAPAPRSHDLRRGQRDGALPPHGGAVVHAGAALRGRLGLADVQRRCRVRHGRHCLPHGGALTVHPAVPAAQISLLLEAKLRPGRAGVQRPRPPAVDVEGGAGQDSVEHRAAAGWRLCAGQRQRGVRFIALVGLPDDATSLHPAVGHHRSPMPPHCHLHRVRQQRGHGNAPPADPGFHVSVHQRESFVRDDPVHFERIVRLHAARGHASQRHRLLFWVPQSNRHGKNWRGDEHHRHCVHQRGHQHLGSRLVLSGLLPRVGQRHHAHLAPPLKLLTFVVYC